MRSTAEHAATAVGRDNRRHPRAIGPLTIAWTAGLLVLWATLGLHAPDDAELLLDPAAVAGLPWYTGLISNLGILGWTAATVAAAGAALVARLGERHGAARFLRQGSLLSLLMTLDDVFQLHSSAFPKVFGVPKIAVVGIYALLAMSWVLGNLREVERGRWGLLVAAGVTFAASVAGDRLLDSSTSSLVFEDGAKFLAVLAWATYFAVTATDIATSVITQLRHSIDHESWSR